MATVTFEPGGTTVDVHEGENLLRAAIAADVQITASCGGDGTCGKCRMLVEHGSVESRPSSRLTDEDAEKGYVLACLSAVRGDVRVTVPAESRPSHAPAPGSGNRRVPNALLSAEEHVARVPHDPSEPPVTARVLSLTAPDLANNCSDLARVRHALRREYGINDAAISLETLRALPDVARAKGWTVTAIMAEPGDATPAICGLRPGDTSDRQFAIAVDVGTTTIEAALIDLFASETMGQSAEYSDQIALGEDVITRVIAGSTAEGLEDLRRRAVTTIGRITERLCAEHGVSHDEITSYVAAGNTVMTHLLLGISPANIRTAPYVPVAATFPWTNAVESGLPGGPGTQLVTLPCPASWLGGDIVAGVLAAGIPWSDKLTLFVDIGTNGEIVLGSKDWLAACSCSAGPAFEGRGITHGMRAAEGAVELVRVDTETLEPMLLTIGSAKPLGICGSGLVDCISELFLCGALNRDGTFQRHDGSRIRERERGAEYVLVWAEESGTGSDIVINETDIENLMRAKAAIHAGIDVLLETVDVEPDAIEEVVVAGGFGHYLDIERVMTLGMLPELPAERFQFIGNGSLFGARLAAKSRGLLARAQRVADMMTYVELSVNASFMDMYVSSLFLPHTDLHRFPRTEALYSQRATIRTVG